MNKKTKQSKYYANANVDLMGKICNSDQWWNNDKCWCACKKSYVCEKYCLILLHVIVEMENI